MVANPNNPRRVFAEEDIESLARSLREKGVLQPIVVRPMGDGIMKLSLVNAAGVQPSGPGIHTVPVIVRDLE